MHLSRRREWAPGALVLPGEGVINLIDELAELVGKYQRHYGLSVVAAHTTIRQDLLRLRDLARYQHRCQVAQVEPSIEAVEHIKSGKRG